MGARLAHTDRKIKLTALVVPSFGFLELNFFIFNCVGVKLDVFLEEGVFFLVLFGLLLDQGSRVIVNFTLLLSALADRLEVVLDQSIVKGMNLLVLVVVSI